MVLDRGQASTAPSWKEQKIEYIAIAVLEIGHVSDADYVSIIKAGRRSSTFFRLITVLERDQRSATQPFPIQVLLSHSYGHGYGYGYAHDLRPRPRLQTRLVNLIPRPPASLHPFLSSHIQNTTFTRQKQGKSKLLQSQLVTFFSPHSLSLSLSQPLPPFNLSLSARLLRLHNGQERPKRRQRQRRRHRRP